MDNIEVLKNVRSDTKEAINKISKIRKLNKKDILFRERDVVQKVYFVLNGKLSIFKMNESGERKVIFILRAGDMIDYLELGDIKTTAIGCEAFENATVLECDMTEFVSIMEKDFTLCKNVINTMQNRSRRLYRQLKNTIAIRLDKKLAAKLYRLGREFGTSRDEWTLINVNITITYLADMLGCKRESLSRAMKVLQDEGLVKLEKKKYYIKKEELSNYFKST
ncbi:MAG: Crp/Fnr family transcriptional regulator [Romboutsia sp.]|uniref:Crp/Fnr family transcriptional regulator n=1 Tax=Romboutsia sp. TaxID=1965302 RepID=UPI003F33EC2B